MSYHFSKTCTLSFDDAIARVTECLKKEGFGVLTEIDVKDTLKRKLDVDFRRYKILGACNPSFAYRALQAEDKIGTMLPCNVIVQELADGTVEVSAVDPVASMLAIKNPELGGIAEQVREKLKNVVASLLPASHGVSIDIGAARGAVKGEGDRVCLSSSSS
jgi:uncharacterized protein (DUF302 family)